MPSEAAWLRVCSALDLEQGGGALLGGNRPDDSMNDLPERQDAVAAGDLVPGTFTFDPAGLPGDGLTYAILSQPSEGWAINNHDGSFFFDPVMDFRSLAVGESRRVKFTYQVSDGQGATQTATTTLVVTGRSDAPPMVELSGVVAGADPAPAPRPTPPREPGFITGTPEDTVVPEESLPEPTTDMADDVGAIELVDVESPLESAPETPLDQTSDAWPGGMAVEEQQRRVESSLVEDAQDHAAETAVFDAPSTVAQGRVDELAADRPEMAPASAPAFGESDDAATDWAANPAQPEPAQPPAGLSADETLVAPEMPELPEPIGVDGYQSDQFPLSPAGEAAMESMAAPGHDQPVPDLSPESRLDNAFGGMADAEPMTSFMTESAPATTDMTSPDEAVGWGDSGPKSFAYADVATSGQIGYRILSQPIEGWVEDRGDGSFTFEPGSPLLDMAIGEMCQVDFTYQVEIDGQDTACMKATVTVTGTSDGPEPDAVSFGPGEATDSLESASAMADFAAAPVVADTGVDAAETPLPLGPADLDDPSETPEAAFEELAVPLPLGPADDRLEVAPAAVAPVSDGGLSDEMPPGTEPWPVLDPAIETSLRKSHNDDPGVSLPLEPISPVAELAAEHGTDVPDSIPAFLAGEPEPEAADSPVLDDPPLAEQSDFGAQDAAGDEMPPVEQSDTEEPRYLDDTPAVDLSTAAPEASAEADVIEDVAATPPLAEQTLAYIEDTAADFSSSDQESGDGDLAPLDAQDGALDEPPAAGLGGPIDLAAAYLKAQGAELSAPVVEPPPAQENTFDQGSGPAFSGEAPQVFDDESPFESLPEQPAPAAESAVAAAGEIALEGRNGRDLLPGMTAADLLKSVVGGSEDEAEDVGGEIEDGERSDTLHVDGVNGGPGVGGWDLELTEGDIVETHSEYILLSSGAAGAVVLDGNVGLIKFEGIERIVW